MIDPERRRGSDICTPAHADLMFLICPNFARLAYRVGLSLLVKITVELIVPLAFLTPAAVGIVVAVTLNGTEQKQETTNRAGANRINKWVDKGIVWEGTDDIASATEHEMYT